MSRPPRAWSEALPALVEAFFVTRNAPPAHAAQAEAFRDRFVEESGVAVPLLGLDLNDWRDPVAAWET